MAKITPPPSRFDTYFGRLIGHEGGFSKDPEDPGNWTGSAKGKGRLLGTKFGIAANTYPDLDIPNLTLDAAKAIYRRDWWDKIHGDDLPPAVSFQLWDMAINTGMPRAVMALQRGIGVADDGRLGPITLRAINDADQNDTLLLFNAERLDYYTRLSKWPRYGEGWTRRVAQNLRYAAQDN